MARLRYRHRLAPVVAVPWEHTAAAQQNLVDAAAGDVVVEPLDVRNFHGVHSVPWKAADEQAAGNGSTVAASDHSTVDVASSEGRTSVAADDFQLVTEWDL